MKLELKHLVGYFLYKLMCKTTTRQETVFELTTLRVNDNFGYFKPILRPLSDLTKEIEANGEKLKVINFIPEYCLEYHSRHGKDRLFDNWANTLCVIKYIKPESLSYSSIQILLEYHFDIHNLIKNNLAININDL